MKKSLLILAISFSLLLNAQVEPNITEATKNMSLGAQNGYNMTIPNQEKDNVIKIYENLMKSYKAKEVKVAKESNEIIYEKIYLKDISNAIAIYAVLEQQGRNVGWTGYFISDNETKEKIQIAASSVMQKIFKQSMWNLYDDSLKSQNQRIGDAEKALSKLDKSANKSDKSINKANDKIRKSKQTIEEAKILIPSLTTKLTELNSEKIIAKENLNKAEEAEATVKSAEKELKEMLKQSKTMSKNISSLEKDPALNANLILAQQQDLSTLSSTIVEKQTAFKTLKEATKKNIKAADKQFCAIEKNIKNVEKEIKSANKDIAKAENTISDAKSEIGNHESQIENIESSDKVKQEAKLTELNNQLQMLKASQTLYK